MTLEDVATAAGVSPKTVSRVMNNEPNVRESTREKVLAAAKELGYRPNRAARSLAGTKSYAIAHLHDNPNQDYTERANAGIYRACRVFNYQLFLEPLEAGEADLEQRVDAFLASSEIDGAVLSPPSTDDLKLIELLKNKNVPVVSISPAAQQDGVASVYIDERAAAALMTNYLIGLGHKRIGFIAGPSEHGSASARGEGFEQAILKAGLVIDDCPRGRGDFSFKAGMEAAEKMLSQTYRPTAIFAANDVMGAGAMTAAFKQGLSVPGDVSIAGFDASYIGSIFSPKLTTIRQPVSRMAEQAAEWLISGELTEGEQSKRCEFPFELVENESTAPPRS